MILSIIIPIYNVEKYIERCLLSVFNQNDLNDTEIILVDDCGTDKSMTIVNQFIDKYSALYNIKIISHTHNQGLSVARNTGVKHAKGNYIFFLDSDDELPENTINIFNRYLENYGDSDCFIGNYSVIGKFVESNLDSTNNVYNNKSIYELYMNGFIYPMAWGKFIKRSFFEQEELWFPANRFHEDLLFSFKLALKAHSLILINEYVYVYRIRELSITTKKKRKNYIDTFWILSQQIQL